MDSVTHGLSNVVVEEKRTYRFFGLPVWSVVISRTILTLLMMAAVVGVGFAVQEQGRMTNAAETAAAQATATVAQATAVQATVAAQQTATRAAVQIQATAAQATAVAIDAAVAATVIAVAQTETAAAQPPLVEISTPPTSTLSP
jgi:hypothetical protein